MSVKNKAILMIYDSIVNERKDLHARLKKTTANDRFLFAPTVMAAKQTINEVKRLKLAQPQQDRERGEWLAILAFQAINKKTTLEKRISKKVYEYTREYEGEQKEDLLLKTAEINRSEQVR
jgi:histone H3/H4